MTQAWDKELNQTSYPRPPEHWTRALSSELQELIESKAN